MKEQWKSQEIRLLRKIVKKYGDKNWEFVAKKFKKLNKNKNAEGSGRTSEQCEIKYKQVQSKITKIRGKSIIENRESLLNRNQIRQNNFERLQKIHFQMTSELFFMEKLTEHANFLMKYKAKKDKQSNSQLSKQQFMTKQYYNTSMKSEQNPEPRNCTQLNKKFNCTEGNFVRFPNRFLQEESSHRSMASEAEQSCSAISRKEESSDQS